MECFGIFMVILTYDKISIPMEYVRIFMYTLLIKLSQIN